MTTKHRTDDIVERYLFQLDAALGSLPEVRRRQIVEEIADHISEGRSGLEIQDEVGLRALLDRVGDPELIAAEAGIGKLSKSVRRRDAWVPWLLLFGGFAGYVVALAFIVVPLAVVVGVIGWSIGLKMLWTSNTWGARDKVLGTLVLPGGLLAPVVLLTTSTSPAQTCFSQGGPGIPTSTHCTATGFTLSPYLGIPLLLVTVLAPFVMAVHLNWARQRSRYIAFHRQ
jgi:hypothetical protein